MSGDSAVEPKPVIRQSEGSTEKIQVPLAEGQHDQGVPPTLPDGHIGSGTPPPEEPAVRSAPVTIYLEDETGYAAVEDAIENVLALIGAHLENRVAS